MRKMRMVGGSTIYDICGWVMTKNGWEYYFTDSAQNGDIRTAIVCGFETELGDISMSEIEPYIKAKTFNQYDIDCLMPALGYEWL
jgi:hypothetical protein